MAWNEPGGNNDKDPWGGDQGPPDLDEAFRKFKEKFGGGGSNNKSGGGTGGDIPVKLVMIALLVVATIFLAINSVYTVDAQEKAVVLRFGKYHRTENAGLHFNLPLLEVAQKVNVTKQRSQRIRGLMLTEDENIVEISVSVQYTISDPKQFLLEVRDPERSLQHAAESALRHVVGSKELHQVLTEGRKAITIEVEQRLQGYLNSYLTGIDVTTISIEDAQPPKEVQAAFDDVIRAKEDEQRAKNEAETYAKGIIPEARGLAQRQLEEANAYKEQIIAEATGEASRFTQLRAEYEKAPKVTRERLYISTMEKVLGNSSKVMMGADGGNLTYLPLDKLMENRGGNERAVSSRATSPTNSNAKTIPSSRGSSRSSTREAR